MVQPPIIPVEHFFTNPDRIAPRLSTDGTFLAYLAPGNTAARNLQVWVQPMADWRKGTDHGKVQVTNDLKHDVRIYNWASNGKSIVYLQDHNGDENFHLFVVSRDGGEPRDLTPFDNVTVGLGKVNGRWMVQHKTHANEALVALNRENSRRHDLYQVNLETGDIKLHTQSLIRNRHLLVDDDFQVKAALSGEANGDLAVRLYRGPTLSDGVVAAASKDGDDDDEAAIDARWPVVMTAPLGDELSPLYWDNDTGKIRIQTSVGHETSVLVDFDPITKIETIVAKDAVDVHTIKTHPYTQQLQFVSFSPGRTTWTLVDESLRADWERVKAYASECDADVDFYLHDNAADDIWTLRLIYADKPFGYVLYHKNPAVTRPGSDSHFETLFGSSSSLEGLSLGRMESISYFARDGLPLQAYVTYPYGYDKATGGRLPTVLLVHGGPWDRDDFGYSARTHWLANRGYLVVQTNYRGSTGFNKKHLSLGFKQWGKTMHTDLLDTVDYVTNDMGIVDRDHVAIFGSSYGGYAALAGVTLTPDFFTCAVDLVGPSDLAPLIRSFPAAWGSHMAKWYARTGHPEHDAELLREVSPLTHAHRICKPLLIGQGKNDPRVTEKESEQIVKAIEANGGSVCYVLYPDEGHSFTRPVNRNDFYAKAELFLAKHMGPHVRHQEGLSFDVNAEGSSAIVRVIG
ncbi:Alpha/Beta hydrolase protein [Blastocladiella britannica]|nr:Alpha/Beta hydrolase protein [Blastocladiella britannica]